MPETPCLGIFFFSFSFDGAADRHGFVKNTKAVLRFKTARLLFHKYVIPWKMADKHDVVALSALTVLTSCHRFMVSSCVFGWVMSVRLR